MNTVLQFFASFCIAAIFIGALFIICPDGAMSKTVKYALSLVFLCIVISTAGITVRTPVVFESPHSFSEGERQMEITFARQVYARALYSKQINFKVIEVFTNKQADDSIIISKVQIFTEHSKEAVLSALEGLNPKVEVEVINE